MGNEQRPRLWLPAMSRRQLILGAGVAFVAVACGDDDDSAERRARPRRAARRTTSGATTPGTGSTASTGTAAAAGAGKPGGTLRVGLVGVDERHHRRPVHRGQGRPGPPRRRLGGRSSTTTPTSTSPTSTASPRRSRPTAADHYVIRLKEGIEFHDGKTVTADDLIYSFNRRLDPDLGLAPALAELLESSGHDEGRRPHGRGAAAQAGGHVPQQPRRVHARRSSRTTTPASRRRTTQIGTGPFMLASFTPGAESVHEQATRTTGGKACRTSTRCRSSTSPTPRRSSTRCSRGEIDAAVDVPFAQVPTVEAQRRLRDPRVAGRQLAADHDGRRPGAVRRRPRAPGDAADRRPRGDGRSACCPGTAGSPTTCTACSTPATPATSRSASRTSSRRWRCSRRPARQDLTIDLFAPDDTAGPARDGRRVRRPGQGGRRHRQRPGARRRHVLGRRVHQAHVRHQLLGHAARTSTRSPPAACTTRSYPETHWPPDGSDFDEKYNQALADGRPGRALRDHPRDAGGGVRRRRQHHRRSSTASSTPTHESVQGLVGRPNVLNLDHFGRGFENIWLDT